MIGGNIFSDLLNSAGTAAQGYFQSQAKPPAATANTQARKQPDLTMPLAIGGGILLLVIVLVLAFRK